MMKKNLISKILNEFIVFKKFILSMWKLTLSYNRCVCWPCTQQTQKITQNKILQTKKHLKYQFKHLEIEWNLKKPLVFSHLHKTKEGGQYQFEEQNKIMKGVKEQRSNSSKANRELRVNNKEP